MSACKTFSCYLRVSISLGENNYSWKCMVGILSDARGTQIFSTMENPVSMLFLLLLTNYCCWKAKSDLVKEGEITEHFGIRIWPEVCIQKPNNTVGNILHETPTSVSPSPGSTHTLTLLLQIKHHTFHIHYNMNRGMPAEFKMSKMIYYTN